MKKIGAPAMVRALDLSPDGKFVRVTRMVKPFSYVVPVSNFGSVDEIWDIDGKMMVELEKRPLNEGVADDTAPAPDPAAGPGGGAQQQGRRELAWRADGQGLTYLEQEPAPAAAAGAAGAAGRAGGGRAGRGGAARRRSGGRRGPRPGAGAQGSPLSVAAAVRREGREGHLREQHADDRRPLLARHADDLLPGDERPEHRRRSPST